ncbi:VapE domain-containing protein [Ruminococcus sp.]|uniref:VapE domain-containing protein n=1 Tax=Ruminococcus sp. TaxID=41978 RepID=UPI0035217D7A
MSLTAITLQYSSVRGKQDNTSYPFPATIKTVDDLKKVAQFDHVCGEYADGKNNRGRYVKGYRSKKTFRKANCLPLDTDNANSDPLAPDIPESEWKTPADVRAAFPDVPFYVVYSRNHMKVKDGKPARPKFHSYFIITETASAAQLANLKKRVQKYFPAFDSEALDAARFLYGVENPQVEFYDGDIPLDVFMKKLDELPEVIACGTRNGTLSRYAAKIFKKCGDTEKTRELFLEAANRCEEPLPEDELQTIWRSAQGFFHNTIEKDPEYIPPDEFAAMEFGAEGGKKAPVTSGTVKNILNEMNIKVRLNVISGRVEIEGMPPQHSKANAANVLPVLLTDYMTRHNLSCSRQTLDDCLVLIEDENRFNPVYEMLKSTNYDGTDRLVEIADILGIADNETAVLYLTKWLHQCVAMALNDEAEPYGADGVLVIRNPQGAGKTLFCSKIAMKSDWFAEGVSIDLDKKDTVIQSTGVWIAEMGELDSTLKREQLALKAFVTARKDTYRQPYARVATTTPRRTSFCATVNPEQFLNDETGSRRWWVIEPKRIDCERLKALPEEWFVQLWAQVYTQLYLPNPQGFRLTDSERAKLQADNERYNKPLPGETEILDKLEWNSPESRWKWYTVTQIRDGLNLKSLSTSQVGKALKKLSDCNDRIQIKASHNVKRYLLPPMSASLFYPSAEDFKPPLSDIEPLTAVTAQAG